MKFYWIWRRNKCARQTYLHMTFSVCSFVTVFLSFLLMCYYTKLASVQVSRWYVCVDLKAFFLEIPRKHNWLFCLYILQQYRRQEGVSFLVINWKRAAFTRKRKLPTTGVPTSWTKKSALKNCSSCDGSVSIGEFALIGFFQRLVVHVVEWSRVVLNRIC